MSTKSNKSDQSSGVLIRDAAMAITMAGNRHCGTDALRKAAKRYGVCTTDERGRAIIPRAVVEEMARNFALTGYLVRRSGTYGQARVPVVSEG